MNPAAFFTIKHKFCESDLWLAEPFTRGQAWIDLIKLANYQPGTIRKRGVLVEVPRGGVGWSERELSKRWKWSRGKFRRFITELEKAEQIVPQKSNVTTCFVLVNYDHHQLGGTTNGTTSSTTDGPQTVPEEVRVEVKKGKKEPKTNGCHVLKPDGVDTQIWADFNTLRKNKKSPLTATALSRIEREAVKAGVSLDEALSIACERGWQSFRADWHANSGGDTAPREKRLTGITVYAEYDEDGRRTN